MTRSIGQAQVIIKFLVLTGLSLAIYAQTFDDPFHFDDLFYITNNTSIRHLANFPQTIRSIADFQISRFVVVLTFAINYHFHQLNVFGYHLVNFLIHVLSSCLVWWMGELCFILSSVGKFRSFLQNKGGAAHHGPISDQSLVQAPYWAALLFAVHPLNTQAVVYISQRCESLATLFYVAAVCSYLQQRISETRTLRGFMPALICGLLGMFSKETVITLPLTIIFLEFFFFKGRERFHFNRLWLIFGYVCLILVVPALLGFNLRQVLFSSIQSQSHSGDVLTLPTYLLTQSRVFVRFLSLMIAPLGMNLDYDFPMSHTLFERETFLSFLTLGVILFMAVRMRRKIPMMTFAIVWFFLTLSANLIPRANVIFEHKMYLALAGVLPPMVIGLFDIVKDRRMLTLSLSFVVLVFSLLSVQRNSIWRDEITLWTDVIVKSPQKSRPYNHRGMAYKRKGSFDLAVADFNRVIDLDPEDASAYLNRANLFKLMGNNDQAFNDYSKAILLDSHNPDAYASRSSILRHLGQFDMAKADLDVALRLNPNKSEYFSARAHIRQRQGDIDGAIQDCNQALRFKHDDLYTYNNRGNLYLIKGDAKAAAEDYDRAIKLDPRFAQAYLNRAVVRLHMGLTQESVLDLRKAQSLGAVPKDGFLKQLKKVIEEEKNIHNLP